MIDSFVNTIVLYDDNIIFYFNYKENAETLYQKDLEDFSDLFVSAPPLKLRRGYRKGASVVIFYGSGAIRDSTATVPRDKRKRISKVKTVLWTVLSESVDQTRGPRHAPRGGERRSHGANKPYHA